MMIAAAIVAIGTIIYKVSSRQRKQLPDERRTS
jgi:hypothetical protein